MAWLRSAWFRRLRVALTVVYSWLFPDPGSLALNFGLMNPTITEELNLRLSAGIDLTCQVTVTTEPGPVPVDLTGATATLLITQGSATKLSVSSGSGEARLVITDAANGVVDIDIPGAASAAWRGNMNVRLDLLQGTRLSRLLRGVWNYNEL